MAIPRFYPVTVGQEPTSARARPGAPRTPVARDEAPASDAASAGAAPEGGPLGSTQEAAVVLAPTLGAAAQAQGTGEAAANERLETVRAQIRNGTYKVDRDKLTERLVQEEVARSSGGRPR